MLCTEIKGTQSEHCRAAAYGDAMKVELLQMATLMIRRAPQQLVQNRKEFIKFGWNNLKKDDSAVKYYAFQNVCHFFDAYAAPEKIVLQVLKPICVSPNDLTLQAPMLTNSFPGGFPAHSMMPNGWEVPQGSIGRPLVYQTQLSLLVAAHLVEQPHPCVCCFRCRSGAAQQSRGGAAQVFVALLRLCQADNKKALVRDALDTLTPVLVRRLAPGDLKYPIWVRYTKKVLVEEGHSTPHLIHIWQLLVRHADLYYSSR